MSPTRAQLAQAQRLLEERRLVALADHLDGLDESSAVDEPAFAELRAELARRGAAPISDLLRGAEHLLATPAAAAGAVIRLAAAGARLAARDFLGRAQSRHGARHPALVAAAARVRVGDGRIVAPVREQIDGWLLRGERERAGSEAERLLGLELDLDDRRDLLELTADLAREHLAFAAAAERLERRREAAPHGDDAGQLELKAALDRWSAGQREQALQTLRLLRGRAPGDDGRPDAPYLRRLAAHVLRDLERHPEPPAGPSWILHDQVATQGPQDRPLFRPGPGGALALICWVLGLGDVGAAEGLTSAARLRRELSARGIVHTRTQLDAASIERALAAGAVILLEEERPSSTGFLWLRGFDPVGRLLLLVDPAWVGPFLRPLVSQIARSSLFGFGALLIWGKDALGQERYARAAALGLEHDIRLDLIDRCELDESGRVPPRARVARLAEEGIRLVPELPLFYLLRGQSLLAQLCAGHHDAEIAGEFERWLATTHRRFPDAEWVHQIYARALEAQGRSVEAGIAYHDAERRDPADKRNFAGHGRALLAMDRPREAYRRLRRAAALGPGDPVIQSELAQAALACGEVKAAELDSTLALDLDPARPEALIARVDTLEARVELEPVIGLLGRASALSRDEPEIARRLLRRHVQAGLWPEARRLAEGTLRAHSQQAVAWRDAAWVAWCEADLERAQQLALDGLQRVGADEPLVELLARIIIDLVPLEALSASLRRPLELLGEIAPLSIKTLALALADAGHADAALAAAERARRLLGDDVNGWWHLAQVLLRLSGEHEAELERALNATREAAPPFAYVRIVQARRCLDADDATAALELLEDAAIEQAPGLIWWLTAEGLDRIGRADEAARVRERLPEIFPSGVLDHTVFLRQLRLAETAAALLEQLLEHFAGRAPLSERHSQHVWIQLGLARGELGDHEGALEALLRATRSCASAPLPYEAALESALALGRWREVEHLAGLGIERARRNSRLDLDPWPLLGARAGALLANGRPESRLELLDGAPRHPGALAWLWRVEERLAFASAADDSARLARLAPGRLWQLREARREAP